VADNIGRISTTGAIEEYAVPTPDSDPTGITAGPDGALWFTEFIEGKIGRISTSGVFTEYGIPAGGEPNGITAGPDGALWFTDYITFSDIGRITTGGILTQYPAAPGDSGLGYITAGPDGALWYTEEVGERIGRAPACGLGFSASFAHSALTMNFNLGIDVPATFSIHLINSNGSIAVPYSKGIPPVVPVQGFTLTWSPFPDPGEVTVEPILARQPGGSGLSLCSEWTTVNTAQ
jgi:hypothetical protein